MMGISRRRFLQVSGAGGAALALGALVGCGDDESAGSAPSTTAPLQTRTVPGAFTHGVASGDPHPTSVVLWTRIDPAGRTGSIPVRWQVSDDEEFSTITAEGTGSAGEEGDWTVKVVAEGLRPGTSHRYRFLDERDGGAPITSPIGRTRTAPDAAVDQLRIGVVSCSNYGFGYFHAYRHLLERDLDVVVHLGDYIYEYANEGKGETYGTVRTLEPETEILTLDDYRIRYGHYRSDPDLQELHRLHPMIHVWDDHEFADDPRIGGAANHQPEDGDWDARVESGLQAYTEWMPTRIDGNRIYRTFDYGPLATIVGIDRQRRFLWPEEDDGDLYLGRQQSEWLEGQVSETEAGWCVLAQQTTFGPTQSDLTSGGWPSEDRNRVLAAAEQASTDLVVLTGDIHRFHAMDVVSDPAAYKPGSEGGSSAVEFSCGSISSPGSAAFAPGPQLPFSNGSDRGYAVLTLTEASARCDFWGFEDRMLATATLPEERWLAGFETAAGARYITAADGPPT